MSTSLPPPENWPRPIGFAFSGGGSWGATQVGMLSGLYEAGVGPDLIVGTSVGALNGAVVAAQGADAVDRLKAVWMDMDQATIFGGSRMRALATFVRTKGGYLSPPENLRQLIATHCPYKRIEELPIPFAAVVTDVLSGDPRLIDHGPLANALLASAAIPGVFPSVEIDGRQYVDGGVVANLPTRPTLQRGAKTVVILDATPEQLTNRPPTRPVRRLMHTGGLMLRSQASADLQGLTSDQLVVDIPRATPNGYGSFNFDSTDRLMELGRQAVDRRLNRS